MSPAVQEPAALSPDLMNDVSFVPPVWFLVVIAVAVLLLVLEGWRQSRKLKSEGKKRSRGSSMMAAGVLELQGMLQPDRHVEQIQEEARDKDRLNPAHRIRKDAEGEPGSAGGQEAARADAPGDPREDD